MSSIVMREFIVEYKITSLQSSDGEWDALDTPILEKVTVMDVNPSMATKNTINRIRSSGRFAIPTKTYPRS